jgi:ribonuclease J
LKNKFFSVLPIGGVDEIGSNMTLIRTAHEDIVIDCGLLFPYEECFDINYLVPDFGLLDETRVKNIVITHGHEDHIGGLSQLLAKLPNIKLWVTPFTHHLVRKKLEEFRIDFNFQIYQSGQDISFQQLDITPVHVNHSIPETNGLVIRTKDRQWGALYISDFKVDLKSKHEDPMDLQLIKNKLSECSQTAYFIDSTNVIFDGKTTSENELLPDLEGLINRQEDRVFITLFASNVHRMNAICLMAKRAGRKIVVMGRSLWNYMEAARESGHSDLTLEDFHTPDQAKGQTGKMLIFLSGCQGDFLSALRRFSFGEDGTFKPQPGDLVIFSSKVIPGNEKKIFRIYNKLTQFGAEIITAYDHLIHASGHPGKEDLKILIDSFLPTYYFPIHGESYMLKKHQEFLFQSYPTVKTLVIHNYDEVILGESSIKIEHHESKEPILIHGKNLIIEKTQISQRRKMATQGSVFITYQKQNKLIEISLLGLPLMAQEHLDQLKKRLLNQIENDLHHRESNYFKDQLKISTRQFFNHLLGYKPVTEVHLF